MPVHSAPATSSPAPAPPDRPGSRRTSVGIGLASLLIAVLLGGIVAWALGPRATLDDPRSGDPTLAAEVEASVGAGRGLQTLSVARVQDGATTYAGLGDLAGERDTAPNPHTPYELGSITKTWTGMLLADAVERGEMRLDAPLSTYLPELEGTPAGGVPVEAVATHTSGLPRLAPGGAPGQIWAYLSNSDPYDGWTTERLLERTRAVTLDAPGAFAYSNLGVSLLGHAEARAAGARDWPTLVQQRLFEPLGMTETSIVPGGGDDPAGLARPHFAGGTETEPWSADGYAPSGSSTRTTAADMATFAAAVLRGKAPGMAAVEPRADASGDRKIGLTWFTAGDDAGSYLWHNGGTGGSSSVISIDREKGWAAVVLGNSETNVDHVAPDLVHPGTAHEPQAQSWSWIPVAIAVVLVGALWWKAWRGRNRLELIGAVIDAGTGSILAWSRGAWHVLPEWMLGSILATAFVGAVFALSRMREVPTRPASGMTWTVLNLAVSVALFVLFALGL